MTMLIFAIVVLSGLAPPALADTSPAPLAGRDISSLVFVTNKDSNNVSVVDMESENILARFTCSPWSSPHASVLTPDGQKLVVPSTNRDHVTIFDVASGETLARIETGQGPRYLNVTPDSRFAYVCNHDGYTISVIDLDKLTEIAEIEGFSEPYGVSFLPDGTKAYVANAGEHEIDVIDTQTHHIINRIAVGRNIVLASLKPDEIMAEMHCACAVALTRDGRYGYVADCDTGDVTVINTETDGIVANIPVGKEPTCAYLSPDDSLVLVPNNGDRTVSVINTKSNMVVATLQGGKEMTGINFVNGGEKAYAIAGPEGSVYVYDLDKLVFKKRLVLNSDATLGTGSTDSRGVRAYIVSPDTDSLYVLNGDTDSVSAITDIGRNPCAVYIHNGYNYCH
ncbi:MAG: YncE family protein [Planctomycetes bacterium]|nr:YncE family protein [Planctomycetota bacterium]